MIHENRDETAVEMLTNIAKEEYEEKNSKKKAKQRDIPAVDPDEEIVEGRFRNIESPGGTLVFNYDMKRYSMEDGKIYKVPLKVARHLNDCKYKVSDKRLESDGRTPHHKIGSYIDRFAFEGLAFLPQQKFGSKPRLYELE